LAKKEFLLAKVKPQDHETQAANVDIQGSELVDPVD
jgi:hypothetical protein